MSGTRLFSDTELEALARSPRAEVAAALEAGGDDDELEHTMRRVLKMYEAGIVGFHTWVATIEAWVAKQHGTAGLERLAGVTAQVIDAAACGLLSPSSPPARGRDGHADDLPTVEVLRAAAGRRGEGSDRDVGAALALYDRLEADARRRHDRGLDWVCALLSHIYREYGLDGLEASIRESGDATLLAWMPHDRIRPVAARLPVWARLLKGNFASLEISEDDEKFTIVQDPCGSCGRQLSERAYPGTLALATVSERCPLTRGQGDMPIYRTHAVVMHAMVPGERHGAPWPVVLCPPGHQATPCRILLFKDPDDQRAWTYLPEDGRAVHPPTLPT